MSEPFIYEQPPFVAAILDEIARQNPQGQCSQSQLNVIVQAANQIITALNNAEQSHDK